MRVPLVLLLIAVSASVSTAEVSKNPKSAPKGTYTLEPSHSSVIFCIQHMGISNYCGRFAALRGKISFNGAQPEKSTGKIELDVTSIDTPSDKLDEKLRTEFLEVAKFPSAEFDVRSISMTSSTTADLIGDLTLHGTTRTITLRTTFNGGRQHPLANAYVLGFSATGALKISEFSFPEPAWKPFIGNDVALTIEAEFIAENTK